MTGKMPVLALSVLIDITMELCYKSKIELAGFDQNINEYDVSK